MTHNRYDELYACAWHGMHSGRAGLSAAEIAEVARALEQTTDPHTKYRLLQTLGYTRDRSYQYMVESFLAGPSPHFARLALWILCNYWQLTAQYLDQVLLFIRGVPWDHFQECQMAAVNIAVDYIIRNSDDEMLHELLTLYEDPITNSQGREAAYFALSNLAGTDELEEDLPDDVILERVRKHLAKETN